MHFSEDDKDKNTCNTLRSFKKHRMQYYCNHVTVQAQLQHSLFSSKWRISKTQVILTARATLCVKGGLCTSYKILIP